jgi:hypothetical protein
MSYGDAPQVGIVDLRCLSPSAAFAVHLAVA